MLKCVLIMRLRLKKIKFPLYLGINSKVIKSVVPTVLGRPTHNNLPINRKNPKHLTDLLICLFNNQGFLRTSHGNLKTIHHLLKTMRCRLNTTQCFLSTSRCCIKTTPGRTITIQCRPNTTQCRVKTMLCFTKTTPQPASSVHA